MSFFHRRPSTRISPQSEGAPVAVNVTATACEADIGALHFNPDPATAALIRAHLPTMPEPNWTPSRAMLVVRASTATLLSTGTLDAEDRVRLGQAVEALSIFMAPLLRGGA